MTINQLHENAWNVEYARIADQGLLLVDLTVICSRMKGISWKAVVNHGTTEEGAHGHGKGYTSTTAVDAAIADYRRAREAWRKRPIIPG